MKNSFYAHGSYKAQCDQCGRIFKGYDLRQQWDGLVVCNKCYDIKHPDLTPVIAPREDPMVPDARPRPSMANLTFIELPGVSIWDGVMWNGRDYNTEFTWEAMDIPWDEFATTENDDFR